MGDNEDFVMFEVSEKFKTLFLSKADREKGTDIVFRFSYRDEISLLINFNNLITKPIYISKRPYNITFNIRNVRGYKFLDEMIFKEYGGSIVFTDNWYNWVIKNHSNHKFLIPKDELELELMSCL
jgi:hypothetical protein